MKRINIFLYDNQIEFINTLPQTISETIRTALDDYIEKHKNLNVSASESSKSKRKEDK